MPHSPRFGCGCHGPPVSVDYRPFPAVPTMATTVAHQVRPLPATFVQFSPVVDRWRMRGGTPCRSRAAPGAAVDGAGGRKGDVVRQEVLLR